jgi:hypothetical protein
MNEDKVPKVMRMCIDEVEKRGLNIDKIYSVSLPSRHVFGFMLSVPVPVYPYMTQKYGRPVECTELTNLLADMNSIQLLRRFESEKSFSFTSTDNIHSVAALLKVSYCNHFKRVDSLSSFLALPLRSSRTSVECSLCKNIDITHSIEVSNPNTLAHFMHMHILMSRIDEYTKNNFSLLRSKIRELHPVHRASLEALLRHLLRVASHSQWRHFQIVHPRMPSTIRHQIQKRGRPRKAHPRAC